MFARFRNLIFDLDGTLVDSLPGLEASITCALQQCLPGRVLPPMREHVGPPIAVMLARVYPELSTGELDTVVQAFRSHYNAEGCRTSLLYPGVSETLQQLQQTGASMFVLTNKPSVPTRSILEQTGILGHFRAVVSADSVQPAYASKTAAAQALAAEHELDPGVTVLVGDGADDARAAEACGFAFVLARYGYGSAAAAKVGNAVAAIDSFREILFSPYKLPSV